MSNKRLSTRHDQLKNADRAVAESRKLLDEFWVQRKLDQTELVRQTESLKKMRELINVSDSPIFRVE